MTYQVTVHDAGDAQKGDATAQSPYSRTDAIKVNGLYEPLLAWGEGYGFDKPVHIAYGSLIFATDQSPNGVRCDVGGKDGVHFTQDVNCCSPASGSHMNRRADGEVVGVSAVAIHAGMIGVSYCHVQLLFPDCRFPLTSDSIVEWTLSCALLGLFFLKKKRGCSGESISGL